MNTCLCAGNSLKMKPQNKMKIKNRKNIVAQVGKRN